MIKEFDLLKGEISYVWKVNGEEMGPGCYFLHFGNKATREWLYNREVYRLSRAAGGLDPSRAALGAIWMRGMLAKVYNTVKSVGYKAALKIGLKV